MVTLKTPPSINPKKPISLLDRLKPQPIVGNPVSAMGGQVGTMPTGGLLKPIPTSNPSLGTGNLSPVKTAPNPYGRDKFNPISGNPVNVTGGQMGTMSATPKPISPMSVTSAAFKPISNPAVNKTNPIVGQPVTQMSANSTGGGLAQHTIDEIIRKAKAGEPMQSPTPEKNAIYEQYRTKLPAATSSPTTHDNANWNSNQSIPDFLGMTPEMIQQIMSGYNGNSNQYYDPNSDPVYKSMMELATKQADAAGLSTMEDMNERGILNSTITSDRVGQIKQGASDAVLGAIPGLAGNFANQQANNQAGMQNMLNSILGAGQFQQTFAEGNRQFDKNFTLDEAATTGRYMPAEAQSKINRVLELKQINEKGGISSVERAKNSAEADSIRRELSSMGVDTSSFGSNTGYSNAMQSIPNLGRNTLAQQGMDLDKSQVMGTQQSVEAQGLIQTILKAKQGNENKSTTASQKQANNVSAANARNQLAALGFDVSKLGSNVGYAQALKNSNSLGAQTLDAKTAAADQAIKQNELAFEKSSFNREMTFKEESAYIEADLKSRGYDIEEVKNSIDLFSAKSDADYKIYQQSLGINDQDAEMNTNQAITEALKSTSASEALAYITKNGGTLASQGVNVSKVLQSLVYKFPEINKVIKDEDAAESSDYRDRGNTP